MEEYAAAEARARDEQAEGPARAARRRRSARSSPRSTARCLATRWASSSAASRTSSTRRYATELLKGEHSAQRRPGHRLVERASRRSASRPASRRSTFPRWCRSGCGRSRSSAATRSCSSLPSAIRRARCYIAQLALEAGLPPGVLNVVNGDKEAVDALLDDPRVQAVSFVGSTPIAEYIYSTRLRERQARAGARRREEPRRRDAGRRHRQRCQRADGRRLRLLRRALHGDPDSSSPSATRRPTRWSQASRPRSRR